MLTSQFALDSVYKSTKELNILIMAGAINLSDSKWSWNIVPEFHILVSTFFFQAG